MLVKSAGLVTSLAGPGDFPGRGLPEIVVAGKSNVGKSSMINALTGRSKLARTSGEPGKTRLINIFDINNSFFLVDLPGYGFAKVSKGEKQRWVGMIEGYFKDSEHIRLALLLVDIRHAPGENDLAMAGYLRHFGIPFVVVATKGDKLSGAARSRTVPQICRALGVQPWEVFPYSSVNELGRDPLWARIEEAL